MHMASMGSNELIAVGGADNEEPIGISTLLEALGGVGWAYDGGDDDIAADGVPVHVKASGAAEVDGKECWLLLLRINSPSQCQFAPPWKRW